MNKSEEIMKNSVYEEIYREGYRKGQQDERKELLGTVDFKVTKDVRKMRHVVEIEAPYNMTSEQIVRIMIKQMEEADGVDLWQRQWKPDM